MELSVLRPVYAHDGPFATVYLEGRSPSEDAHNQMRLRWKALRERLESAGADKAALDAIGSALVEAPAGEEQTNGRVMVADSTGVLLDEAWDAALGAGDDAHWTVVPELGAYAREKARGVRTMVVVADQDGAVVRREVVAEQHRPQVEGVEEVLGTADEGFEKLRGQAHAYNRVQRRIDESVQRNAKDVTEHVRRTAESFRPEVLVLAGEVQARAAVRDELPVELGNLLAETGRGGNDGHSPDEALTDEVMRIAAEMSATSAKRNTEAFQEGLAHEGALEGGTPVGSAAETGAVSTLLFEPGVAASREASLLKLCASTGSEFALVAEGTGMRDGVGALLRFPPTHPIG